MATEISTKIVFRMPGKPMREHTDIPLSELVVELTARVGRSAANEVADRVTGGRPAFVRDLFLTVTPIK